jgi:ribonucleoside-diphosphate reductase alpha chain
MSQPLNTKADKDDEEGEDDRDDHEMEAALGEVSAGVAELACVISTSSPSSGCEVASAAVAHAQSPEPAYVERIVERIIERPMRRRLPDTRRSVTHHFNVAGHEGYLTVGMYDDGSPGELFITMSKEGSTIGGLMDSLGTAISVALQYGVPIESLVNKFAHQRFEPMGMSTNRDIPFAKSLVDYIFRWMGMEFIPGYREANAPARPQPAPSVQNEAAGTIASSNVKEDNGWLENSPRGGSGAATSQAQAGTNGTSVTSRLNPVSRLNDAGDTPARTAGPAASTQQPGPNMHAALETKLVIETSIASATVVINPLDQSNAALMGDAPACDVCGSITVRNGSCYKCMNCGQSMGCS